MKQTKQLFTLFTVMIIFISNGLTAQTQETETTPSLDNGTIDSQFEYLINKSSTYQDYKVVKAYWLSKLKSHVSDTLKAVRKDLKITQKTVTAKNSEIDSLQSNIRNTNEKLTIAIREKNSLQLLGMKINKTAYNSIMWSVTGILALFLLIFLALYKRSNSITVQIKKDLRETKEDFESHRKRAREREEKLVHDLHAEKNKNRN
jgi:hypothetical protein